MTDLPAPRRKEGELVHAAMQTLRAYGIVCWRNNTGMMRGSHKGKTWVVRMGFKGISDIVGFRKSDGRIVCVECKVSDRPLTPEQAAFLRTVTDAGGLAFVARSVMDVKEHLDFQDEAAAPTPHRGPPPSPHVHRSAHPGEPIP